MTEASTDITTQAVSPQTETNFRTDFELRRELPEQLKTLAEISSNFYWSWQPEGIALFRDLDPALWDKCEQNPRLLLKKVSELRLWQKASEASYVDCVQQFSERQHSYLTTNHQSLTTDPIAYFCAEYGVHNSLPNYSGGLGILTGDHLKSASDLDLPLTAVGLLYRYGYFRQRIRHDVQPHEPRGPEVAMPVRHEAAGTAEPFKRRLHRRLEASPGRADPDF